MIHLVYFIISFIIVIFFCPPAKGNVDLVILIKHMSKN